MSGFYSFRKTSSHPVLSTLTHPRLLSMHVACTTDVTVTISFGGTAWPINTSDMNIGQLSETSTQCVGAIYDRGAGSNIDGASGSLNWVVGDTFLKNVYSVFRSSPPSIGFAQLSTAAGGSGAAPSSSQVSSVDNPLTTSSPTSTTSDSVPVVVVTLTSTAGIPNATGDSASSSSSSSSGSGSSTTQGNGSPSIKGTMGSWGLTAVYSVLAMCLL
ncbi:hypothetical protein H0H93_007312 [Arthromyces matolae]|nr:hypothetical protein H0H93_007312 [Arthromyces matolae]